LEEFLRLNQTIGLVFDVSFEGTDKPTIRSGHHQQQPSGKYDFHSGSSQGLDYSSNVTPHIPLSTTSDLFFNTPVHATLRKVTRTVLGLDIGRIDRTVSWLVVS
jgi:hypothetical protein